MNLHQLVDERIRYLENVAVKKERSLEHAPEGYLRGIPHGKGWQYYFRESQSERNGTYIRKAQLPLARKLAQRLYDERVLKAARRELRALRNLANAYTRGHAEEVFGTLPASYQNIVTPIEKSKEEYLKEWKAITFSGKAIDPEATTFQSAAGEKMRSKSEVLIADLLHRLNIPYFYEKPLALKGLGIVHPDFTLLDLENRQEIYWEHLGMLDDPTYLGRALSKISTYIRNGIFPGDRLLLTYETREQPINMNIVQCLLKSYLPRVQLPAHGNAESQLEGIS